MWRRSALPVLTSLLLVVVVPDLHWPHPVPLGGVSPDAHVPLVVPGSDPNSG